MTKGLVIYVDDFEAGGKYRCDPCPATYGDGGIEYNVRPLTGKSDGAHVYGQVTRFYEPVAGSGVFRASDPKKSKTNWKYDTPASEWLDWKPFALALLEARKVKQQKKIELRKKNSHVKVIRNGQPIYKWRNNVTKHEREVWDSGGTNV